MARLKNQVHLKRLGYRMPDTEPWSVLLCWHRHRERRSQSLFHSSIHFSDDISEALMRSVIRNLRAAIDNPEDYTTRSNLMWAATMAENRLIKLGKKTDFECHQMEHQLGAYTDCNHGFGLAVLHPVYYHHIYRDDLYKFGKFATEVWGIDGKDKTPEQLASAGVEALANFIREIGLPITLREIGVTENTDLKAIADSCNIVPTSYKQMTHEEILEIFHECY